MKNHTLQMTPSQFSPFDKQTTSSMQLKERRMCPKGTVPILRTKNKQELYINFAEKDNKKFEHALAYKNNDTFTSVSGHVYVWHTHAEPNEYSISMIGCEVQHDNQLKTLIFAGHGVFPGIYGDTITRLFVGSTAGNYACINGGCQNYVQVDDIIYPGAKYTDANYCRYGDPNYQPTMPVSVYRDPNLGRWWVSFKDKPVGYFAGETANALSCNVILWGGMALVHGENPTPTQMGNGHFTNEGETKTGAISHAQYVSKKEGGPTAGSPSGTIVTRPQCYDFKDLGRGSDGSGHIYLFGGPGSGSNTCT